MREKVLENAIIYFKGDTLAANVWVDKYALRNKQGVYLESDPDQTIKRIAGEFARIESKYDNPLSYKEIYEMLEGFQKVIPAGSPLFGIGNDHSLSTLSNCYVIESPKDSYSGIMKTDEELVQLAKRRGGIGFDISTLRPTGTAVSNSAGTSTGVPLFMERYSNSTREVAQDGRRGALILTINVNHPDIEGFVTAKNDLTKVTGANISVKITDDFMKAVECNGAIEAFHPKLPGEKPLFLEAKKLWDKIVHQAWKNGEPGLIFWDKVIEESPADCYPDFQTVSTNPCCYSEEHDHYVLTDSGYKPIKRVTNLDFVWIPEKSEWVKTSGYFNSGKAEVYEVILSNGNKLHVTNNHKLAKVIPKREGSKLNYEAYELTTLSNLSIGDPIRIYKEDIPIKSSLGTYEEGVILGWLTGDGCLSYKSSDDIIPTTYLQFWEGEKDLAPKIEAMINNLNIPVSLQEYTEKYGNTKYTLSSSALTKYFIDKYQWNIWKFKQDFNPYLYNVSKEFLKGYLQSYFSADGCIYQTKGKNTAIELGSVEQNRLLQVKNILSLFNISSGVYLSKKAGTTVIRGKEYKTKEIFKLSITGAENINSFVDNIGFLNEKKIKKSLEVRDFVNFYVRSPKFRTYAKITSINYIGVHSVGCINVPGYNYFSIDGYISGNSELPLCAYDSCRLLHVNLFNFVTHPFTDRAYFDVDEFYEITFKAQRLMDDLVDLEEEKILTILHKIESDPEPDSLKSREVELWTKILDKLRRGRRTGLNPLLGLADTLAALNIKYDSKEAVDFAYKTARLGAMATYVSSIKLAEERGAFLDFDVKLEINNPFLKRLGVAGKPRRNIACLTIPPSGSVAIISQVSSGIEPIFNLFYTRKRKVIESNANKSFRDKLGDWWEEYTIFHPKLLKWAEINLKTDSTKDILDNIEKSPYSGCTANEIDPFLKLDMQAAIQTWIDHSISITYNFPETIREEDISRLYFEAWQKGLKGLTVYREGSRDGVLVNKKKVEFSDHDAPKRPKQLDCEVHYTKVKGTEFCVLIGMLEGKPYEVFVYEPNGNRPIAGNLHTLEKYKSGKYLLLTKSKEPYCFGAITEKLTDEQAAITRLVSTALRHGANIRFVVEQLDKTEGDLTSFSKAISRVLKKYILSGTTTKNHCPTCDNILSYEGGCQICKNCGFSKCN